jgi:hypothetical protein
MRARREVSSKDRADLMKAPTLSLEQAAIALGVGMTNLRDSIRRGQLPLKVIQVGSRKVISTADVRTLLGDHEASEQLGSQSSEFHKVGPR